MFAEEKPALRPLPVEPFRFYRHGTRTVHLDGAVEVDGAYYHLPPGWLGRRVAVQWDALHVRILDPATGSARARARGADAADGGGCGTKIARSGRRRRRSRCSRGRSA